MDHSIDASLAEVHAAAADVMDITTVRPAPQRSPDGRDAPFEPLLALISRNGNAPGSVVRLRGRLTMPAEEAYERLAERLHPLGRTPVLQREEEDSEEVTLLVLPGRLREASARVGVAAALFLLTALSCLWVGAQLAETSPALPLPAYLLSGLPFAASLLGILVAHESGHYFMTRRFGVAASLPYFIPFPVPPLGTMGAVINMTAPPRNRRQLLAIGAAGPLAGLAVAIPVIWYGLSLSAVQPLPTEGGYVLEGNSLLYAALKILQFGRFLPSGGLDVFIHPVAFAGWAGLLVTSLNLIPAGQLDGGHIFYAIFGKRGAQVMYWVVLFALAGLAFLWVGWLLWVALIFFFGRVNVPPLNDVTPLTWGQKIFGVVMLIIFVLVFIPAPLTVVQ